MSDLAVSHVLDQARDLLRELAGEPDGLLVLHPESLTVEDGPDGRVVDLEATAIVVGDQPDAVIVVPEVGERALRIRTADVTIFSETEQLPGLAGLELKRVHVAGGITVELLQEISIDTLRRDELSRVQIERGIYERFLSEAKDFLLNRANPWFESGVTEASADPFAVASFGQAWTQLNAWIALEERAQIEETTTSVGTARAWGLAKATASISEVIAVLGASSIKQEWELDRAWRDFHSHRLLHPPRWSATHPKKSHDNN